ncbi:MAG: phosphoribosylamine--glycine ligase, partial [Gammaproteobacteria bacterium]|nr:phosphoribosylamine--glycine ligase [Gammaproteobacteria bacterium]
MKVLIVGGGGREHALAWKAAQSPRVHEVLVAPGNAGTLREPNVRNVPVKAEDIEALVQLARDEGVDLTIVGPEQPLVDGIVDRFETEGLKCFGPRAAAARLEGSKAFTKDFLARHGIPTGGYASFDALEPALEYVRAQDAPIVI